ncbi:TetR/AcrR family transcriptional regulator [Nocardia crassostreae]|uniref:TetR/AcrR family transcriptional regulator n=1 Tax=Nocardia crassostreae TaxID=53428 RepID=UPI000B3368BA|nr:TetR/AcrR family transcriptional regulator [Nocardia crassostreae]
MPSMRWPAPTRSPDARPATATPRARAGSPCGLWPRANLSTRFVYESFTDLDDLTAAAFDHASRALARTIQDAVHRAAPDLRARITAVIEAITVFFHDHPEQGKILSTKAYGHPATARRRLARTEDYVENFAELLRGLLPDTPADPRTIDLTARFLVSGFSETATAWIQDPTTYPRETFIHDNVELFLGALDALQHTTDQHT